MVRCAINFNSRFGPRGVIKTFLNSLQRRILFSLNFGKTQRVSVAAARVFREIFIAHLSRESSVTSFKYLTLCSGVFTVDRVGFSSGECASEYVLCFGEPTKREATVIIDVFPYDKKSLTSLNWFYPRRLLFNFFFFARFKIWLVFLPFFSTQKKNILEYAFGSFIVINRKKKKTKYQ